MIYLILTFKNKKSCFVNKSQKMIFYTIIMFENIEHFHSWNYKLFMLLWMNSFTKRLGASDIFTNKDLNSEINISIYL